MFIRFEVKNEEDELRMYAVAYNESGERVSVSKEPTLIAETLTELALKVNAMADALQAYASRDNNPLQS